jgi:hypothetical protein
MTNEMAAHIDKLQMIHSRIIELRRTAYRYDVLVSRGYGEQRKRDRALAEDSADLASKFARALSEEAARWPWPHVRVPTVPACHDDLFYSSYDCPECFHDGTDKTIAAPPTCQRCGAAVEHVPL